jgi:hypothetical protein
MDLPDTVDITSWTVADCPRNIIAKRLLCAGAASAQLANDDHTTGLPLPKPWFATAAKNSPLIESVHVETPLDVAAVLAFYRAELKKRGWTENDGAVVAPDRAAVAFTTSDGPAQLRLIRQDQRTIADLSRRKPDAVNARNVPPKPGQARLLLGNDRDEEAVVTINGQTITLAAGAGDEFGDVSDARRKSQDNPEIALPPGQYKVTVKVAGGAAQNREYEVAAGETWGLMVDSAGAPLPVQLY